MKSLSTARERLSKWSCRRHRVATSYFLRHRTMREAMAALCLGAMMVAASAHSVRADSFELPRAPEDLSPRRAGELTVDMVFPVRRTALCPPFSECVFGGGGGVGATLEWRWPKGPALGIGYDIAFLDGNGVFELTTLQNIRATLRYYGLPRRLIHPFVGAHLGIILLGDTFSVDAAGASLDVFSGAEVEITSGLSFTGALAVRAFVTQSFVSESDGVARAEEVGVNVAIMLRVGLILMEGPE